MTHCNAVAAKFLAACAQFMFGKTSLALVYICGYVMKYKLLLPGRQTASIVFTAVDF